MGIRVQRRIPIRKGVGINVGRKSGSLSYRSRYGSIGTRGYSIRSGIPGLYWRGSWGRGSGVGLIIGGVVALVGLLVFVIESVVDVIEKSSRNPVPPPISGLRSNVATANQQLRSASCGHCGSTYSDAQRFCEKCGSPVTIQAPVAPRAEEPPALSEPWQCRLDAWTKQHWALLCLSGVAIVGLAVYSMKSPDAPPVAKTASPASPAGKWQVQQIASESGSAPGVALTLDANSPISGWPQRQSTPQLVFSCRDRKIAAFVKTEFNPSIEAEHLDSATVRVQFDGEPFRKQLMAEAANGTDLYFANPKATILAASKHERMAFGFVPYRSKPVETSFDLTGLGSGVTRIKEACAWK